MYTYTGSRNYFGQLIQNTSAAALALGDNLINQRIKMIINGYSWPFREGSLTRATVAAQQGYDLSVKVGKVIDCFVTVGTTKYIPKEITSRRDWNALTAPNSYSSNIPTHYFVDYENNQILLYPTPASANTLTVNFEKKVKDLSIADYTTGTIVSITNGASAVVGSGTSWTKKMIGRFMRITDSDTANTGDGEWYEIEDVTDTTHLTLKIPYDGITIAAGSAAYAIGQASIIPEDYQHLPVIKAAQVYFTTIQPNTAKAQQYKDIYKEDYSQMMAAHGSKSSSPVIGRRKGVEQINPNLFITAT